VRCNESCHDALLVCILADVGLVEHHVPWSPVAVGVHVVARPKLIDKGLVHSGTTCVQGVRACVRGGCIRLVCVHHSTPGTSSAHRRACDDVECGAVEQVVLEVDQA
jgi:hypothetical protein